MERELIKIGLSRKEFQIIYSALGWLKEHDEDLLNGRGYKGHRVRITQVEKKDIANEILLIEDLQKFFAGI